MMNFANHMLMMTVAIVRVSQMGMKMFGRSPAVLETPVPPLEKSEGRKARAAKPTMIIVISKSRRGEDFAPPPLCDAS